MALHMSVEFVTSGTGSIIVNLCPILVLIYGVYYFKERLTPLKVFGFLLGLIGGLVFLWNSWVISPGLEIGIIFSLIAMLAWGAYTITLHYLEGANRYFVMTIKHAVSSVMILPFIFLLLIEGTTLILIFDAWSILGLLFSGVLASGLAYVLYFTAVETHTICQHSWRFCTWGTSRNNHLICGYCCNNRCCACSICRCKGNR